MTLTGLFYRLWNPMCLHHSCGDQFEKVCNMSEILFECDTASFSSVFFSNLRLQMLTSSLMSEDTFEKALELFRIICKMCDCRFRLFHRYIYIKVMRCSVLENLWNYSDILFKRTIEIVEFIVDILPHCKAKQAREFLAICLVVFTKRQISVSAYIALLV